MAGMGLIRQRDGTWVYPLIGVALAMVGLEHIEVYINRHQNMVTQYISTRPIMDLCISVERNPVMRLSRQWWEKTALYILGIRVWHAATRGGGGWSQRERESRIGEEDG